MSEPQDQDRHRLLQRLLEMVPGFVSWAIIVGPIWLSFSYQILLYGAAWARLRRDSEVRRGKAAAAGTPFAS